MIFQTRYSENIGDHIMQYYISKQMDGIFGNHLTVTMPTMDDIDYIGTHLHGGIRALNNEKRSLIITVE